MPRKKAMPRTVLLTRRESTMVSSWNEHLCIEEAQRGKFRLTTCGREWIGPISSLRGKSKLFDEDGRLVIPEFWGKKRIVGIGDGEYLETEKLLVGDDSQMSVPFNAISIIDARTFCEEQGWASEEGFDETWVKIEKLLKSFHIQTPSRGDRDGTEIQLISRQEEASPYDEYLYLVDTGESVFELQRRVHDSVGPIQSIPQKNKFFNSKGKRIKPKTFEGSKILGYLDFDGLGDDNSYALLERIVQTPLDQDVIRFSASKLPIARQFCVTNGWDSCDGFKEAWAKVKAIAMGTKLGKKQVLPRDESNPLAFTKNQAVIVHSSEGTNAMLEWHDFIVVTRTQAGHFSIYARKYGWDWVGNTEKKTWIPVERFSGIRTPTRFISAVKSCEVSLSVGVDWVSVIKSLGSFDAEFSKRVRVALQS